jgi:hypothetical protein
MLLLLRHEKERQLKLQTPIDRIFIFSLLVASFVQSGSRDETGCAEGWSRPNT